MNISKRRMSEDIKDQSRAQNKDYFIAKPTLILTHKLNITLVVNYVSRV
jgi:hypothetical protein